MVPLSPPTKQRLVALFRPSEQGPATVLLEERCGSHLPFIEAATPERLERVRFAVLKLSQGDLEQMREYVHLAETDWRDLLVDAGFADDPEAHLRWWPASPSAS
jgi:hypothetical protein